MQASPDVIYEQMDPQQMVNAAVMRGRSMHPHFPHTEQQTLEPPQIVTLEQTPTSQLPEGGHKRVRSKVQIPVRLAESNATSK